MKKRKVFAILLSLILVVCCAVAATSAFALQDGETEITWPSTFTFADDTEVRIETGFKANDQSTLGPTADALSKVYVTRGETVYKCSHVYEWGGKITFYFNGSGYTGLTPADGDVLTVKAGFKVTTKDSITYVNSADKTWTYNGAWSDGSTLPELSVVDVQYSAQWFGNSTLINLGADCGDYWKAYDTTYVTYVDSTGANVLTSFEICGTCITMNRNGRAAAVGDVLTLKAGFVWLGKEAKEDLVYKYVTEGSPYKKIYTGEMTAISSSAVVWNKDWSAFIVETSSTNTADITSMNSYAFDKIEFVIGGETYKPWMFYTLSKYLVCFTKIGDTAIAPDTLAVGDKVIVKAGCGVLESEETKYQRTFVWDGEKFVFDALADASIITVAKDGGATKDQYNVNLLNNTAWGAPTIIAKFAFANNAAYGTYYNAMALNKDKISYVNAYGETAPIADCTYVNDGNFVLRLCSDLNDAKNTCHYGMVGDKITFHKGMIFIGADGAVEALGEDMTFVVATTANSLLVEDDAKYDVTSVKITNDLSVVHMGSIVKLNVEVNDGALGTAKFTSSDEEVATVNANGEITSIKLGMVKITATVGEKSASIDLEVKDASPVSYVDFGYKLWVLKGGELPSMEDFSAKFVFEDDSEGQTFKLTSENFSVDKTSFDKNTVGSYKLPCTITVDGVDYDDYVSAEVYELANLTIKETAVVDWFGYNTFVEYPNSSSNKGNITNAGELGMTCGDYFEYLRNGEKISCGYYILGGGNLAVLPSFLNGDVALDNFYKDYYNDGDLLVLKKGLTVYKFTGDLDANNSPILGTGMYIPEACLAEDVTFRFEVTGSSAIWAVYKEYVDITATSTSVSLEIGKKADAGVKRNPVDATTGTITYVSSDETIAKVNEKGVITAQNKAGTATITATISGGTAGEKKVTITVTVTDYIKSIANNSGDITVTQGTELDLTLVKLAAVYASGTVGDSIDLTNATIVGYDKDTLGEQTVTVKFTLEGTEYTQNVVLTVVKKGGCGAITLAGAFATLTLVVAASFVFIKRK